MFMNIISVDLDDTLISTKRQYTNTREWFGEYLEMRFSIPKDVAMEEMAHWSEKLTETYGLSKKRYPKSAVKALDNLVEDYDTIDQERVYEIARSTFKSRDQYKEQGFIEGDNTREFLNTVNEEAEESLLLTSGDPDIQWRKINALNLQRWFDTIEISDMGEKPAILSSYSNSHNIVHIGNSTHSDVKAASKSNADCIHIPRGEWIDTEYEYSGNGQIKRVDNIVEARHILKEIL